MPLEIGLKLWNTNVELFAEAKGLYTEKIIDFIELYIVPTSYDAAALQPLAGIPIRIHAPHENHQFNIFAAEEKELIGFQKESVAAANLFNSPSIVMHAGVGSEDEVFAQKLSRMNDPRIIIENMPFFGLHRELCYGYSLAQLKYIYQKLRRSICLDLGHAVKSAVTQSLEYKPYIEQIIRSVYPTYFHLSDGDPTVDIDEHLNLGTGNYDLSWMKRQLLVAAKHQIIQVVFEVPKNNSNLTNDCQNIRYFQALK